MNCSCLGSNRNDPSQALLLIINDWKLKEEFGGEVFGRFTCFGSGGVLRRFESESRCWFLLRGFAGEGLLLDEFFLLIFKLIFSWRLIELIRINRQLF